MQYELCYLIAESRESEIEKIKEDISKIIEKEGGKWLETQWQDKRKMAYKVKGQFRGIYIARRFELPAKDTDEYKNEIIQNISKQMKLNHNVLRFIIVKADELPDLKNKPETPEEKFSEAKKRAVETSKTKKIKEQNDKSQKTESIDKRLEEILNI